MKLLDCITHYVKFFLVLLGLTYLFDKSWNSLLGDSILRTAAAITILVMLLDLGKLLYQKFKRKTKEFDN